MDRVKVSSDASLKILESWHYRKITCLNGYSEGAVTCPNGCSEGAVTIQAQVEAWSLKWCQNLCVP